MIRVQIGEAASYAAAGVDIDAGDTISGLWNDAARQTYGNRTDRLGQLITQGAGFASFRGIDLDLIQGQTGLVLTAGVDGVGTKARLAEQATERREMAFKMEVLEEGRDHAGIFQDVVAMTADDIARDGGEPFAVATLFDTNSLSPEQAEAVVRQLCIGAVASCNTAQVVYLNGETAELGERVGEYGPFNYNLGGFAIGVSHRSRILTGEKIRPGDSIVAVREHGFRANGMSLVRKVLAKEFGEKWHLENEDLAGQALRPSAIYTPAFVDLHGGYDLNREPKADISAIVHVTGGGIPGKLQRKLAVNGYGAILDDLYDPPEIMRRVQEWSMKHDHPNQRLSLATPDPSLYQSLNGGNGALIITREPQKVIDVLATHDKESKVAGKVIEASGIELRSQGVTNNGEWILFVPRAA